MFSLHFSFWVAFIVVLWTRFSLFLWLLYLYFVLVLKWSFHRFMSRKRLNRIIVCSKVDRKSQASISFLCDFWAARVLVRTFLLGLQADRAHVSYEFEENVFSGSRLINIYENSGSRIAGDHMRLRSTLRAELRIKLWHQDSEVVSFLTIPSYNNLKSKKSIPDTNATILNIILGIVSKAYRHAQFLLYPIWNIKCFIPTTAPHLWREQPLGILLQHL